VEIKGTVNVTRDLEQVVDQYNPKDPKQVGDIRKRLQLLTKNLKSMVESDGAIRNPANRKALKKEYETLKDFTEYAPTWVLVVISLSLGLGTMVGWKRIVVTIGEKIGKSHLTYAQGATAEIIAATTIGLSTQLGLPVSTTHVLSSGVAGTMVASNGTKNLQGGTIRNIALAWLLTLPVTIILAGGLYALFRLM
jgi:PiT family inorganic phosphate transporter